MKMKTKKGFTLIELLIVIAIIGILASIVMVSLTSASTKARVAAMKSSAASVPPGIVMCCDAASTPTWGTTEGAAICTEAAGINWPTSDYLGTITAGTCSTNFTIAIDGTGDTECDAGVATCGQGGCTFPANCP